MIAPHFFQFLYIIMFFRYILLLMSFYAVLNKSCLINKINGQASCRWFSKKDYREDDTLYVWSVRRFFYLRLKGGFTTLLARALRAALSRRPPGLLATAGQTNKKPDHGLSTKKDFSANINRVCVANPMVPLLLACQIGQSNSRGRRGARRA